MPQLDREITLLAVSGGVDSMVMARLFAAAQLPFAIAHCNFQLRGAVSDEDEVFVRALATELNVPYHTVTFETEQLAKEQSVSIQMIARDLRYEWLESIRSINHYQYIATAHHLNDAIETSLLNQVRGTGIRGLTGIDLLHGHLVRPLLFFTRAQIEDYLKANGWKIREDSSNSKDDYYRNRLRHHVVPVMQGINPSLERTFNNNFGIWRETAYLMEWAVAHLRERYIRPEGERIRIDFTFLQDHSDAAATLLFEWLRHAGFHPDQLQQAIESVGTGPGAVVLSSTHRLLVDRDAFWVEPIPVNNNEVGIFKLAKPGDALVLSDGILTSQVYPMDSIPDYSTSVWQAVLDLDRLTFPLHMRRWQAGDVFHPLGMKGHRKKVQDYFTDLKINRFDKEKIWLLTTADDDIVWLMGYRIDERYKIREETRKTLLLRFVRN
ncbi:MAG: tRNA lysidine(34) synthetase TilS [Saprospiraceae bacterium]